VVVTKTLNFGPLMTGTLSVAMRAGLMQLIRRSHLPQFLDQNGSSTATNVVVVVVVVVIRFPQY